MPAATFGLVHGAWHGSWCWELLIPELESRGFGAIAADLPREDPAAGPAEYADAVARSLEGVEGPVVLVGHSLGGLTISNVAALRPVDLLVFLCALVPAPGRSWDDSRISAPMSPAEFNATIEGRPDGSSLPRHESIAFLYQACPADLAERSFERLGPQTYGITQKPSLAFPALPAAYILCRDDRAILNDWSYRTARTQLGVEPIALEGDHSPFLGRPQELAGVLAGLLDSA